MKFLEFLLQNGPSRWIQLERLVDLDSRKSRSARTGKVLRGLREKKWVVRRKIDGKSRYDITEMGKHKFMLRKTASQLAACAPYYFKHGKSTFISFGDELALEDQKKIVDIYKKHPDLRTITSPERERKPREP